MSVVFHVLRDGIVARFVATDGGITRVYPKRYSPLCLPSSSSSVSSGAVKSLLLLLSELHLGGSTWSEYNIPAEDKYIFPLIIKLEIQSVVAFTGSCPSHTLSIGLGVTLISMTNIWL